MQAQLDSVVDGHARVAAGDLVAGHKKDLVLTRKMQGRPDRVAIYGWHRLSGEPIQPVSTVHVDWYADYSHGVRLVWHGAYRWRGSGIAETLADPATASILSDEGPLLVEVLLP